MHENGESDGACGHVAYVCELQPVSIGGIWGWKQEVLFCTYAELTINSSSLKSTHAHKDFFYWVTLILNKTFSQASSLFYMLSAANHLLRQFLNLSIDTEL